MTKGFFTLAYVFTPDEARSMADIGVDGIVVHIGVGGEMRTPEDSSSRSCSRLS